VNIKHAPGSWLVAVLAVSSCLSFGQELRSEVAPTGGGILVVPDQAAESEVSPLERSRFWKRDFSSPAAYESSVRPNRESFRRMLGAIDARAAAQPLDVSEAGRLAENDLLRWEYVRWPVFEGVWGEGLYLRPKTPPVAFVVALPDADQTPEMLAGLAPGMAPERQFARRLAEQGCEVLAPALLPRRPPASPNPASNASQLLSPRDRITRQAFPLGRHVLGYEVQKVLAGVDVLMANEGRTLTNRLKVGVAGYGEGGLIAFYSAALDARIAAAMVSGYFDSRRAMADEPLSRNLFGFQREFGDAEIATLIAPRALIVEYSLPPELGGVGVSKPAGPEVADYSSVEAEFDRARALLKPGESSGWVGFTLISGTEGMATGPGSDRALAALLKALGVSLDQPKPSGPLPENPTNASPPDARQQRQFDQLEQFTRRLGQQIERGR